MKKTTLGIITLLLIFRVCAQNKPGGVEAPAFRLVADSNAAAMHQVPGGIFPGHLSYAGNLRQAFLNGHPALQYDHARVSFDMPGLTRERFSLFIVQHNYSSTENLIWSVQNGDTAAIVLTNKRAADLTELQYLSFTDIVPFQPKIDAYIHQAGKVDGLNPGFKLNLGKKPVYPELPVADFSGLIPEVIGYNKVLNTQERNKVCTYLALKYGITLSEPGGTYLNRNADIIWNGSLYPEFHHNIAGLGRDDSSSLFQTGSGSQNFPGLLTIAANTQLADNDYFIWGDNDLPLSAGPTKKPGLPFMIQRKSIMVNSSASMSLLVSMVLNTRQLDVARNPETVFWLAIDSSGVGNFGGRSGYFIRMSSIDPQGHANFNNVHLGFSNDHKASFGWTTGKKILMTADITQPSCNNPGNLLVKVWGAHFPCRLFVKRAGTEIISGAAVNNANGLQVNDISAGYYSLKAIDADNNIYTDSFYVSDKNVPWPSFLEDKYFLNGPQLRLDAAISSITGAGYQWLGPNGFFSTGPVALIREPGIYTICIEVNGCRSFRQIIVEAVPKNIFTNIQVSPNPSSGTIKVSISLDKPADVLVELFTEDGRLVSMKKLEGMVNYFYTDQVPGAGMYFMVFRSGLDKQTKKIVIIR